MQRQAMKRASQVDIYECAAAKRPCHSMDEPTSSSSSVGGPPPAPACYHQQPGKEADQCASISGASATQLIGAPLLPVLELPQEPVLNETLGDADLALRLALHAMFLATKTQQYGQPDAADKALDIAEQALATTMQQLSAAQALIGRQVQQLLCPHAAAATDMEDADVQDTCSSGAATRRQ